MNCPAMETAAQDWAVASIFLGLIFAVCFCVWVTHR